MHGRVAHAQTRTRTCPAMDWPHEAAGVAGHKEKVCLLRVQRAVPALQQHLHMRGRAGNTGCTSGRAAVRPNAWQAAADCCRRRRAPRAAASPAGTSSHLTSHRARMHAARCMSAMDVMRRAERALLHRCAAGKAHQQVWAVPAIPFMSVLLSLSQYRQTHVDLHVHGTCACAAAQEAAMLLSRAAARRRHRPATAHLGLRYCSILAAAYAGASYT